MHRWGDKGGSRSVGTEFDDDVVLVYFTAEMLSRRKEGSGLCVTFNAPYLDITKVYVIASAVLDIRLDSITLSKNIHGHDLLSGFGLRGLITALRQVWHIRRLDWHDVFDWHDEKIVSLSVFIKTIAVSIVVVA